MMAFKCSMSIALPIAISLSLSACTADDAGAKSAGGQASKNVHPVVQSSCDVHKSSDPMSRSYCTLARLAPQDGLDEAVLAPAALPSWVDSFTYAGLVQGHPQYGFNGGGVGFIAVPDFDCSDYDFDAVQEQGCINVNNAAVYPFGVGDKAQEKHDEKALQDIDVLKFAPLTTTSIWATWEENHRKNE